MRPVLLAFLLITSTATRAATLAFENFQFPPGNLPTGIPEDPADEGAVIGPNGNTREAAAPSNGALGFATGYLRSDGTGVPQVGSNTLGVAGVETTGDQLEMPGDARVGRFFDVSADGPFGEYLTPGGQIGADGKTLWLAFVFSLGDGRGTQGFGLFRQYIRGDGAPAPVINIGVHEGTFAWRRTSDGPGSEWQPIAGAPAEAGVYLIVVKMEFAAGEDTFRIFINPTPAAEPANDQAAAVIAAPDLAFDAMAFASFGDPYTVSNLRVAGDFAGAIQTSE